MPDAVAPQYISTAHRDQTAELGMWVFLATEVLLGRLDRIVGAGSQFPGT